jgi:hypothetical protein
MSAGGCQVVFHPDLSVIRKSFAELSALIEARQVPPEVGERLVGLIDAGAELFAFECDDLAAAGTGHVRVIAKPGDAFSMFLSAARTADREPGALEVAFRHLESSLPPAIDAEHAPGPAIRPESGACR